MSGWAACYYAFSPRCFFDQIRVFRMCQLCQENNPEMCQLFEKYAYVRQRRRHGRRGQRIKVRIENNEPQYRHESDAAYMAEVEARYEQMLLNVKKVATRGI